MARTCGRRISDPALLDLDDLKAYLCAAVEFRRFGLLWPIHVVPLDHHFEGGGRSAGMGTQGHRRPMMWRRSRHPFSSLCVNPSAR